MAVIPVSVIKSDFSRLLVALGYPLLYRGKVGELYEVPGKPSQLLMVRSDRLSIFDFVLRCLVRRKGEVLIAITHYWLTQVFRSVPNHLLAWGMDEERWTAAGWDMADVEKLPLERTLLVERREIWPYEMIYRAHIGGSVWNEYLKSGTAGGNALPQGLSKWQRLTEPIFTPTTKAETGHDVPMTVDEYAFAAGEPGRLIAMRDHVIYNVAYHHARQRGLLVLDTKFENSPDGKLVDEVLTPDSSRFTTPDDLEIAVSEGRDPTFYDKEPVRVWGRGVETPWGTGINNLDPADREHLEFVAGLEVPMGVVEEATNRYLDIVSRLTTLPLEYYRRDGMSIPL